jgi:hypothetical protein
MDIPLSVSCSFPLPLLNDHFICDDLTKRRTRDIIDKNTLLDDENGRLPDCIFALCNRC